MGKFSNTNPAELAYYSFKGTPLVAGADPDGRKVQTIVDTLVANGLFAVASGMDSYPNIEDNINNPNEVIGRPTLSQLAACERAAAALIEAYTSFITYD